MEKYTYIKGFKFSSDRLDAQTTAFYYLIFKVLDGDELAKTCAEAIMQKLKIKILVDADRKQVYPPVQ